MSKDNSFDKSYVHFPAYLIRDIFKDKYHTIDKILTLGIYRFAIRNKYTDEAVAKHVLYLLYQNKLPARLLKSINNLDSEIIGQDEDYKGFNSEGVFEAYEEVSELIKHFETHEALKRYAVLYYQVSLAFKILGITGNEASIIEKAQNIEKGIPTKNTVLFMISKSLLFDFRDNEKAELEIAQLMAFTAIKSIIGKKKYGKTNKSHILARMFGYASVKDVPENPCDFYKKYSKRYHIDRIIQQLELHWHVKTYSNHMRGLYVSIGEELTFEMLAQMAENNKIKNQVKDLEKVKSKAKAAAINAIKERQ